MSSYLVLLIAQAVSVLIWPLTRSMVFVYAAIVELFSNHSRRRLRAQSLLRLLTRGHDSS